MAIEPWELKADDTRTIDTLTIFIIFCEDELCEPYYFREFEKDSDRIKINTIENSKAGKLNLNTTVKYCFDRDLMIAVDHKYKLKDGVTENIWCVYDRDFKNEDPAQIEEMDDIDFTNSVHAAEATGVRVAWSNDAFELWILLHFETIATGQRLHRKYIYDRLSHIFKNVVPRSAELDAITNHGSFTYKKSMKRKLNFLLHVLPLLKTRRQQAIANSLALEATYAGAVPYHNCNPCTKVHHLVNSILAASL